MPPHLAPATFTGPHASAPRPRAAVGRALAALATELALVALAVAAGSGGGAVLGRAVRADAALAPWTPALGAALTGALLVGVLVLGVRVVERRPVADAGLVRLRAAQHLALGAGAGAAAMTAVVAALALAGWYRVAGVAPAAAIPALLARSGALLLAAAIAEEVVFRAILFRLVERAAGTWVALGASALLFGLAHLGTPHATLAGALAIALEAGVALGALYARTRSLWPVVGVHWGWNVAEGPVFGTALSGHDVGAGAFASVLHPVVAGPVAWTGGAFGPEAGVAAVLLWALVGAGLLVALVRRGRVVAPPWGAGSDP